MANTFDPGKGTSWRYGRAVVATMPKTGSTGTALFWRYGRALTFFAAVTIANITIAPNLPVAMTTQSSASAGLSTTATAPTMLSQSASTLLSVALGAGPQPTAAVARSSALLRLAFGFPNRFDPGLGTSWRYGQPYLAVKPKLGNTGTSQYWRRGMPLSVYSSALLVVLALPVSGVATTAISASGASFPLLVVGSPALGWAVTPSLNLVFDLLATGSPAIGQATALVLLVVGFTAILLPTRVDLVTNGRTYAVVEVT